MTTNALITSECKPVRPRPMRDAVLAAVRLLIEWTGDDSVRDGLIDTPARVVCDSDELLECYHTNSSAFLGRSF